MNTVRSSRSESRSPCRFAACYGFWRLPAWMPLPCRPLRLTLMASPYLLFGYRTYVRYSTAAKRYSGDSYRQGRPRQITAEEICPAIARKLGRKRSRISLRVVRVECVHRLSARPPGRYGRGPAQQSSAGRARALRRRWKIPARDRPEPDRTAPEVGDRRGRKRLEAQRPQPPPKLRVVKKAELDAAQRGMKRRQPGANRKRRRHNAAGRHARDIDDFGALQDRRRAGFVELLAQCRISGAACSIQFCVER